METFAKVSLSRIRARQVVSRRSDYWIDLTDMVDRRDHGIEIKRRIGIKYCGGCNPSYERVEIVNQIQSMMKYRFHFLRHDQPGLVGLIFINGCPRACASKSLSNPQVPYLSIMGESDFEKLVEWLTALKIRETNDKLTPSVKTRAILLSKRFLQRTLRNTQRSEGVNHEAD
jgi:hypothetical protein